MSSRPFLPCLELFASHPRLEEENRCVVTIEHARQGGQRSTPRIQSAGRAPCSPACAFRRFSISVTATKRNFLGGISMADLSLAGPDLAATDDGEASASPREADLHPMRRRRSASEKTRIVSGSFTPDGLIRSVAARHGVARSTLAEWRERRLRGRDPGPRQTVKGH